MIAKKVCNPKKSESKGGRVNGLADYIREPTRENGREKCIHSGAYGFLTDTHQGQKAEMLALAQEAVRSRDPINHYVLSWRDGEYPTAPQVDEVVSIFMDELGLKGHQVIYGLHDDTGNMHVHIMINRVHPDTLKVIKPNKGFDIEAAHRAIARIEAKQGWSKEQNARYDLVGGEIVKRTHAEVSLEPTAEKVDREHWANEKSAERIAQEVAGAILKSANSWRELHQQLATYSMRYEKKGSGALVYVGDVALKASNVERSGSLAAMQKRLGIYQPAPLKEKSHDYHHHTQEQDALENREGPLNGMRNLSERRLAHTGIDKKGKGVLQIDAKSRGRFSGRMRREAGRSTGRGSEPLKNGQNGWNEYILAKSESKTTKKATVEATKDRHKSERNTLYEKQKVERTSVLNGKWQGKGLQRNALASVLATRHAAERLEQQERQKAERKSVYDYYRTGPQFKKWQLAPAIVGTPTVEQLKKQSEKQIREHEWTLSKTLRALDHQRNSQGHVTYRSNGKALFRDEGRRLEVLDTSSDTAIAAALAVAQQKFGRKLTITGDAEFQRKAVEVAVKHGMSVTFVDPQLEGFRVKLQTEQITATRQAAAQERERIEAERQAVLKAAQPAPVERKPVPARASAPSIEPNREAATAERLGQPEAVLAHGLTDDDKKLIAVIEASLNDGDTERLAKGLQQLEETGDKADAATKVSGQPVPFNDVWERRAAEEFVEKAIKGEINEVASTRGEQFLPYGTPGGLIHKTYDHQRSEAHSQFGAHQRTLRPEGMFKKRETQAWDQQAAQLENQKDSWDTAVQWRDRLYAEKQKEAHKRIEERLASAKRGIDKRNTDSAPSRQRMHDRAEALRHHREQLEKRIERDLTEEKRKQLELKREQQRDNSLGL